MYQLKWAERGGIDVAVKVCLGNLIDSQEVEVLCNLPFHPNIIKLLGIGVSKDSINTYIITELAVGGSLFKFLHEDKKIPTIEQSTSWALEVAHAMKHLHDEKIIHRDLKSPNVLLAANNTAKICDFGLAWSQSDEVSVKTVQATPFWAAPEVLNNEKAKISYPCDVYSYGVLIYELFEHKRPFEGLSNFDVVNGAQLKPSLLPEYLQSLFSICQNRDPQERPTFATIIDIIKAKSTM